MIISYTKDGVEGFVPLQEIHWQELSSPMIVPCLKLDKYTPIGADRSHRECLDGYIWYWQRPEGWIFKEMELEAWWSDPMTYVEARQSVSERINPAISNTF